MSQCNLDHSLEDVKNKYLSQKDYLPTETRPLFEAFFQKEHSQELLNEVFHLLKKYDLVDEAEREARTRQLLLILENI